MCKYYKWSIFHSYVKSPEGIARSRAQGGERSLEKIGWRLKKFRHLWISFIWNLWSFLCFSMILDVNLYYFILLTYDYLCLSMIYDDPPVIKCGEGNSPINGGFHGKITYRWSNFHCHVWLLESTYDLWETMSIDDYLWVFYGFSMGIHRFSMLFCWRVMNLVDWCVLGIQWLVKVDLWTHCLVDLSSFVEINMKTMIGNRWENHRKMIGKLWETMGIWYGKW